MAHKAHKVRKEPKARKARKELATLVVLVHKAHKAQVVPREQPEEQVIRAHKVRKAPKAQLGLLVVMDILVRLVHWAASLVHLDLLAAMARRDHKVILEALDSLEVLDSLAAMAHRAYWASRDRWDSLEVLEFKVRKDLLDLWDSLVALVWVILDHMAHRDHKATLAALDLLVLPVP